MKKIPIIPVAIEEAELALFELNTPMFDRDVIVAPENVVATTVPLTSNVDWGVDVPMPMKFDTNDIVIAYTLAYDAPEPIVRHTKRYIL